MRGLQIIPHNTKIDFFGMRKIAYAISILLVSVTFLSLGFKGLNLGIDFRGGILFEIRMPEPADLSDLREKLGSLNIGDAKLQNFGSDRDIMIRVDPENDQGLSPDAVIQKIRQTLGDGIDYRRVETVGPTVSDQLVENGLIALLFCLVGMMVYIWARFEWQYGFCAVVALIHDVVLVMGFYSLTGIEFSETALVAILTTVGYSINDSVVIYDRLKENLRIMKKTPMGEVINLTANQTLSRTVLTSGTTLLSLMALYYFGGPVIEIFSLPILVGIFIGTVSSVFISTHLLNFFDLRKKKPEPVPSI